MGYVLGVDLGTTYSAAATSPAEGSAERFPLGNRTPTIPSVVCLREDGEVLVGEAAERRALTEPGRTAREFKRRLGDPTPLILGGTPYGAETLSAHLLTWIVAKVGEQQGAPPDAIVLSHPANWGPYKLELLTQTVQQADVGPVSFITEPEAAAIHYAGQERLEEGEVVAVYDFGGGTFDAAVLRKTAAGFELIGQPEGLERVGGIDFDQAVFAHVDQAIGGAISELDPTDTSAVAAVQRLRDECQLAKEQLSQDTDVDIPVLLPGTQTEVRLTRAEFESMIRPRIAETISSLERAIRSADLTTQDVAKVLLVGGSSRIPLVGQMVREATGRPIAVDAHPKFAIAIGAALLGQAGLARDVEPETPVAAAAAAAASAAPPVEEPATPPTSAPTTPQPPAEAAPGAEAPPAPAEPVAATAATAAASSTTPATATSPVDRTGTSDATGGGGGRPPWLYAAAAIGAIAVVGLGIAALGGGGDGDATAAPSDDVAEERAAEYPSAQDDPSASDAPYGSVDPDTTIDAITVGPSGDVTVLFTAVGFEPGRDGYSVEVGWVDEFSQPIATHPYVPWRESSPFVGFTVAGRPVAASGVCVQTITPEGELPVEDPGHCQEFDDGIATGLPGERFVELDQLSVDSDGGITVTYTTTGFQPQLGAEGTNHLHFYWYPNANEDNVGVNIAQADRGQWVAWDGAVFDAWTTADQPSDATHLCAVVAEFDHAIGLQEDGTGWPSGTCLALF